MLTPRCSVSQWVVGVQPNDYIIVDNQRFEPRHRDWQDPNPPPPEPPCSDEDDDA